MKKTRFMLMPVLAVALSILGTGCVTRATLRRELEQNNTDWVNREAAKLKNLQDVVKGCQDSQDNAGLLLAQQLRVAATSTETKEAIVAALKTYLSIHCQCKHKAVLEKALSELEEKIQ